MIWMLLHTQPTEKEITQTEYRNAKYKCFNFIIHKYLYIYKLIYNCEEIKF